jgi:hypothetical protein
MIDLFPLIFGPWLVLGDFNLIRYPHENNTPNFNFSLANKFNSLIHCLFLQELPLLDRRFTWTNKQNPPSSLASTAPSLTPSGIAPSLTLP